MILADWSTLYFRAYDSEEYAAAKSLQLCPTLSDPMDCSPPGSSVHEIFQARVLEWAECYPILKILGLENSPPSCIWASSGTQVAGTKRNG